MPALVSRHLAKNLQLNAHHLAKSLALDPNGMNLRVKRVDGKEVNYEIDYLRPVERSELDRMLR